MTSNSEDISATSKTSITQTLKSPAIRQSEMRSSAPPSLPNPKLTSQKHSSKELRLWITIGVTAICIGTLLGTLIGTR